jgi:hypothetical protein
MIPTIFTCAITYFMVGYSDTFDEQFLKYLVPLTAFHVEIALISMMIAILVDGQQRSANVIASVLFLGFMLFGGFFSNISKSKMWTLMNLKDVRYNVTRNLVDPVLISVPIRFRSTGRERRREYKFQRYFWYYGC